MIKAELTPRMIDDMRVGATLCDAKTSGLRVSTLTGDARWHYKRKVRGTTHTHKQALGSFPALSIADARLRAAELNAKVEAGIDPREEERKAKIAGMNVHDAWTIYIEVMESGQRKVLRQSTLNAKKAIYKDFVPLKGKALQAVTDDDLWELVEAKSKIARTRANRLAAEMKVFFGFCASRAGKNAGIILPVDPSLSLNGNYYGVNHRKRFLTERELTLWLRALAEQPRKFQRPLLLLLLTACRRTEVMCAPMTEFDGDLWTIPASRYKSKIDHIIPLSPWAKALAETNTPFLVPSPRDPETFMTEGWINKVQDRMRVRMIELSCAPVEPFTIHDLRRTVRTNTTRLKISRDTAEAMLGHKRQGLDEIYDQYERTEEKREGYRVWSQYLIGLARAAGVAEALGAPA